ncbi:hypothetical protein KAT45_02510, partial [Candidatus Aerophobetes bacterium]|nr:hypothetical protein [Candidatus Aerophobetes bacterium]
SYTSFTSISNLNPNISLSLNISLKQTISPNHIIDTLTGQWESPIHSSSARRPCRFRYQIKKGAYFYLDTFVL